MGKNLRREYQSIFSAVEKRKRIIKSSSYCYILLSLSHYHIEWSCYSVKITTSTSKLCSLSDVAGPSTKEFKLRQADVKSQFMSPTLHKFDELLVPILPWPACTYRIFQLEIPDAFARKIYKKH